jgi:hypothetical protein
MCSAAHRNCIWLLLLFLATTSANMDGAKVWVRRRGVVEWLKLAGKICLALWVSGLVFSATSRALMPPPAASVEDGAAMDLRPTSGLDRLGQMMMVSGAFPAVITFYTLPTRAWHDVVVPFYRAIFDMWVELHAWLTNFVKRLIFEIGERSKASLMAAARWAHWLYETILAPIGRLVGTVIDVTIRFVWRTIVMMSSFFAAIVQTFVIGPIVWCTELAWRFGITTGSTIGAAITSTVNAIRSTKTFASNIIRNLM